MTAVSNLPLLVAAPMSLAAPVDYDPAKVAMVVPVKDNQSGLDRLVATLAGLPGGARPAETIVIDNNSQPPLCLRADYVNAVPGLQLARCSTPGPAAARNAGANLATCDWLLFVDSDCIPTAQTVVGFKSAMNGSVGYAGEVRAVGTDRLSRYYDSQKTLVPPPVGDRPAYLVTANALVWREALERVGGFDERFPFAGGEDIDLALRLRAIGDLSYAPNAVVLHDFDDGYFGFVRRFVRYGAGNRLIESIHGHDMAPRRFAPEVPTPVNWLAATVQFGAMMWGYRRKK